MMMYAQIAAGATIIVFLVALLGYQRRRRLSLQNELKLIGRLHHHSVEYELVLKTMHLATWRLDVSSEVLALDNDFRLQTDDLGFRSDIHLSELIQRVEPEDRQEVERCFNEISKGIIEDLHVQFRFQLPTLDSSVWTEVYATVAERLPDGGVKSVVGTMQNIARRKQLESELILARNKAEESDRLKSAFLANISHEIHTPLNAIVGFSDILPMASSEEERQNMVNIIHENNEKLLRIFSDIVNLSTVEANEESKPIALSDVDVTALLDKLHQSYVHRSSNANLRILCDQAAGAITISSDEESLTTILGHFLDNALKFTERGIVTLGSKFMGDDMLRLYVKDTGPGIPVADRERIFERFVKLNDFIQGMGLGLSVSRMLAYRIGASLGVESEEGRGSIFWIDLPLGKNK
ncbi:MAG: PAS domain-containing sensor histidine kinase [Prevotella sp.]|nr:PAS domain-containing sensor histidine kinase [Prevotella sp.]